MSSRKPTARWGACLLAGVVALAAQLGCEEDKPQGPELETTGPIRIDALIVVPKSAVPTDTVSLSVQITSESQNVGDFPVVEWAASGGSFVENNKLAVRWVAPALPQIYEISCQARNSVNTVSASTHLFVGGPVTLIPNRTGEMRMFPNGEDFYYLRTTDIEDGVEIYSFIDSVEADAIPGVFLGESFSFSPDLALAAFHKEGDAGSGVLDQPYDVLLDDLVAGTETQITADGAPAGYLRKHQNRYPYVSPDGNIIAYQSLHPYPFQGFVDTFDVYVYYRNSMTTVAVTGPSHGPATDRGKRRNYFPTVSTDGRWMTFVSDRTRSNVWEMYGLPITGGVVATDSASVVKLTSTGGTVTAGAPSNLPRPTMRWSPTQPVLGVLTAAGSVRLVDLAGTRRETALGGISGTIRDFRWSSDGQALAISTGTSLYTADISGAATLQHQAEPGDNIRDMRFSPDDNWVIYRVQRASVAWFEIVDIGAGVLEEAVVLTKAATTGALAAYGRTMDMSPRVGAGDKLYMITFNPAPEQTPRIEWLDLSTITP